MPLDEKIQCAGGGNCPQRDKCLRYRNRGHYPWASFDVERKFFKDEVCLHRVWFFKKPT